MKTKKSNKLILWFSETNKDDIPLVGSKATNLGEMVQAGFPVLDGFTITINAYFKFLNQGSLKKKIKNTLFELDIENPEALGHASQKIRTHILASSIPLKIEQELGQSYRKLSDTKNVVVTGPQETYLYIKNEEALLEATKKCWASLFTPRAIFYRFAHGVDHMQAGVAIPVQKIIEPEVSGVMSTLESISNDQSKITIEAVYGGGEGLAQGSFIPDRYNIDKKTLKVTKKEISSQPFQITSLGNIPVSKAYQNQQKLADKHIIEVAAWGKKIGRYYQVPQDIKWAFSDKPILRRSDGSAGGKVWIVQTRPAKLL